MRQMPKVEIGDGEIEVDAALVAEGLGIEPNLLQDEMREGRITSRLERGVDDDAGRHRLIFFWHGRCLSLVIDDEGRLIHRSVSDIDPQSALSEPSSGSHRSERDE